MDETSISNPLNPAVAAAGEVLDEALSAAVDYEAGLALVYADACRQENPQGGNMRHHFPSPAVDRMHGARRSSRVALKPPGSSRIRLVGPPDRGGPPARHVTRH